jgi:hypothetical protein
MVALYSKTKKVVHLNCCPGFYCGTGKPILEAFDLSDYWCVDLTLTICTRNTYAEDEALLAAQAISSDETEYSRDLTAFFSAE